MSAHLRRRGFHPQTAERPAAARLRRLATGWQNTLIALGAALVMAYRGRPAGRDPGRPAASLRRHRTAQLSGRVYSSRAWTPQSPSQHRPGEGHGHQY
jgi:hypothetical protein